MNSDRLSQVEGMGYFHLALAIQKEQAEMRKAKNYDWARAKKLGKLNARVLSRLDEISARIEDNIIKILNPESNYQGAQTR